MFLPVWGKWAAYRAQREPEGERRKRSGCANLSPTRVPGDALGIQYYCIACKILSVRRSLSGARKFKVERRLVPNLLNTFTPAPIANSACRFQLRNFKPFTLHTPMNPSRRGLKLVKGKPLGHYKSQYAARYLGCYGKYGSQLHLQAETLPHSLQVTLLHLFMTSR